MSSYTIATAYMYNIFLPCVLRNALNLDLLNSIQVIVWFCLCLNTRQVVQIDVTLIITTFALACEGTKFGLFFDSHPCISDTFWEFFDVDEVSTLRKADTCLLSRGTYMSTCSLTFYSLVIVYLTLVRLFPSYDSLSGQEEEYDYFDDVTIPSFLGSIGKSVISKSSKSSLSNESRISNLSSRRGSNGSRPISCIMEPIVEGDDDDQDDDFVNSIVGGSSTIVTRSTISKNSRNSSKSGRSTLSSGRK